MHGHFLLVATYDASWPGIALSWREDTAGGREVPGIPKYSA